ncbi:peptidylprolyl isomerase [Bacillus gobiensis]|uniref:peptidylprolyl isomerase n=1 Tax=Bacillus gobiensis TaxID=1441095 RepID=UPI003D1962DA
MKKITAAAITATSLLVLSACNSGDSEVIAQSDAGNVTKDEFYSNLKSAAGSQILTMMIQEKVLDEKYDVTDEEIDAKLEEYRKGQMGAQIEQMIQQQGEDYVKQQVKFELLTTKAAEDQAKVTDDEVKKYYDSLEGQIRASHILVADENKAKEVEKKLKDGEKFEDLAKEYSTDGTAQQGGDLGFFAKDGQMVKEFSDAAYKLKVGEVSAPVKTQYGYHIIKKTAERGKYEDMKKELTEDVKKQKTADQATVQGIVDKMVQDAKVDVKDKDLKETFNKDAAPQAPQAPQGS